MSEREDLDSLAQVILGLDWSDMNEFAERVAEIAVDDKGNRNDAHTIAAVLIDWAHDNRQT